MNRNILKWEVDSLIQLALGKHYRLIKDKHEPKPGAVRALQRALTLCLKSVVATFHSISSSAWLFNNRVVTNVTCLLIQALACTMPAGILASQRYSSRLLCGSKVTPRVNQLLKNLYRMQLLGGRLQVLLYHCL